MESGVEVEFGTVNAFETGVLGVGRLLDVKGLVARVELIWLCCYI